MDDETRASLLEIGREWLDARGVIAQFLHELLPTMPRSALDHNAAAVIARLSHAGFALTKIPE
jgi:hypothetical protein